MVFHAIGNCIFILLMTSYSFTPHTHVHYDYYDNDGYEARALHSITIIARLHIRRMIFEQQQCKHLIGYSIHHVSFAPLFIDVKTLLGSVYFVIFLNHRIIAYFKEVIKMKIAFRLVLNSISISISSLLHIFTGWNRVRLNCFLSDELKWLKDVRP